MATLFASFSILVVGALALGIVLFTAGSASQERAMAGSGPLIGFGATWLLLLSNQSASGGIIDQSAIGSAILFGLIPLAIGVSLLLRTIVGSFRRGPSARP